MTLILFDIDGTLFIGQGIGRVAVRHAMLDLFGTVGALDTHVFGGKTDWATLLELLTPLGYSPAQVAEAMPRFAELHAHYMQDLAGEFTMTPCPGAPELVDALAARADVMLGLITGNMERSAKIKLQAVGYDLARFVVGAYGDEADHRNGLPPLALARAEALNGGAFARVVIIGDTVDDIIAARTVRAWCIVVASGFGKLDALTAAQPDIILPDLTDTQTALDAIFDGRAL